ncbi:ferredoxin [Rhizobium tropici]|uniref:Ferredoxin n=1 Tax=Rhizobium tropici TaxID=398 RepID=A0A5B0VRN2_RHITR|nr:ferredoxin [Rhizobium tropici]KAA1176978.1 ferredoxin [Rhizobium tropici]
MTVETKKIVEVDLKLCERQGVCIGIAPSVFQFGKDGQLEILEAEPPEDMWDAIEDAAAACPLNAITLRSK